MKTRLMQGDCLELLPSVPDGSVDMVLCDLPYGVTRNAWDTVIPLEPLWEQYRRVTRPGAAIVLFGQGMFTSLLMQSNPREWRYNLVWDKRYTTGFLNANRMPLRQHEDIAVFYRSLPTYNPQKVAREEPVAWRRRGRPSGDYGAYGSGYGDSQVSEARYPGSILTFPKGTLFKESPHPTWKPVGLLEYLVRTYTDPGMTVLDNAMGSGSTGVACVNTGRDFIGMELDPEFFKAAADRIRQAGNRVRYGRLEEAEAASRGKSRGGREI